MTQPTTLLLVDDNPTFLRILKSFLDENYPEEMLVVGTASDGNEALVRATEIRPDVVLLDLAMPGLNGLNTIPYLRRLMPEVGIIALTVLSTNGYREAAISAGADDFVPKASLNTDLLPAIRRVKREA
jgi:DNA-binding NarL/FixJ family response regulator